MDQTGHGLALDEPEGNLIQQQLPSAQSVAAAERHFTYLLVNCLFGRSAGYR